MKARIKEEKQLEERAPTIIKTALGRMAGEDRRRQIVQVAIRLFSQRGFSGTTTREIALAAGVSEAIIFRHFTTKEDLYAAILDHKACGVPFAAMGERFVEAAVHSDEKEIFAAMAKEVLRHHREDTDFHRLLFYSALEGHELSRMFLDKYVRQHAELICDFIRQRQLAGKLRDIDPRIVARAYMGMVVHHSLMQKLFDPLNTLLDIADDEAAAQFAEILVRGIGTQKSVAKTKCKSPPSRAASKSQTKQGRNKTKQRKDS